MRKRWLVGGLLALPLLLAVPTVLPASTENVSWWSRHRHSSPAPTPTPTVAPTTTAPPPTPTISPTPTITPTTAAGLVFREDFNAGLGQWNLYNSAGHDGQGLRRPSQITTANGLLSISGTSAGTTGGMSLVGHNVRYGTVKVRAKSPAGAGVYHPVALLWGIAGSNPSGVNDQFGELDLMEFWNRPLRDLNGFTLHYGDGSQMIEADKAVDGTQWHTYSVTWTPTEITGAIDDVVYFQNTDTSKFPQVSMEVCLQLDWFPKEATTKGAAVMYVDWIEIWK